MIKWFIGCIISEMAANLTQEIMLKMWVSPLHKNTMTKTDQLKYSAAVATTTGITWAIFGTGLMITRKICDK